MNLLKTNIYTNEFTKPNNLIINMLFLYLMCKSKFIYVMKNRSNK